MIRAQLSAYMYALYLISAVGLPFLFIPQLTLGLFGIGAGDAIRVRFVGVLAGVIGAIYVSAVVTRTEILLGWTVPAR